MHYRIIFNANHFTQNSAYWNSYYELNGTTNHSAKSANGREEASTSSCMKYVNMRACLRPDGKNVNNTKTVNTITNRIRLNAFCWGHNNGSNEMSLAEFLAYMENDPQNGCTAPYTQ